jgi:hypothetical protein
MEGRMPFDSLRSLRELGSVPQPRLKPPSEVST